MASIEQFFVTLNAATPPLFLRFDNGGGGNSQKIASRYKPVRSNPAERVENTSREIMVYKAAFEKEK